VHAAGAKLFVKQIGSNHALWPSVTGKGEDPAHVASHQAIRVIAPIRKRRVLKAYRSLTSSTLFGNDLYRILKCPATRPEPPSAPFLETA
jgi:hypothetical protein